MYIGTYAYRDILEYPRFLQIIAILKSYCVKKDMKERYTDQFSSFNAFRALSKAPWAPPVSSMACW